ncbi:mediator of RNA polymerase II transcription subunit 14-like isoform X2 [Panicum virgatum]|uniref:mediator of RNA polymerase II transcription subunit 14-like isoform X2 n=1 Tax=Panicum virgatum TaxID=38727 RepID=UPI0019D5C6E3|nr:mediator of RNA polymerase II transcription subunit 14-like isoform X2 [Panicum virgatum]
MAVELGKQTVELGAVVRRAAEESYLALRELVEKSQAEAEGKGIGAGANGGWQRSDTEKKIDLLKFITRTRQRMLRLHVLAKWCQQVPLVNYCQQLGSTLNSHETCFTETADWLFFMRDDLEKHRAPMFDVPSATEVMLTGGYQRLPRCIEDIGSQNKLSPDEENCALRKLDASVRYKVLVTPRPKEVSNVSVTDGIAVFRVDGEFKVLLTLGYRGNVDLWRILHMELLVGEKKGPIKLDESRRFALGDDIERRMAASDNPFTVLYAILHEFCISLAMDTIIRQANVLRQGRWKDAIRSELISDSVTGQTGNASLMQLVQDGEFDSSGFKIPGLKVNYWLDGKSTSTAEPDSSPFMKIEAGQEMQIKCQHSSFVIDPFTDKEAHLSLDLSCIDVEQLILRAIACNRHTRLLNIQRQLCKNVQISQSPKDVILKRDVTAAKDTNKNTGKKGFSDCFGNEVLQVRAYGQAYISLGINIRCFTIFINPDCEEALNKGSTSTTEVFSSLRTRSILHLFAAAGRFFGLKVYQQSQGTLKIPETILHGSDLMVMGFPHCANAYYLLMQLDKDFRPVFHLLETQCDASDKTNANADAKEAIRCNKINIGQMQVLKNESNTNPFDVKLQALQSVMSPGDLMEGDIPVQNGIEPLPLLPTCSPSFSSIVDEVFENECGSTAAQNHSVPPSTLPSTSHLNSLSVGIQRINPRAVSPMLDGGGSHTQAINTLKVHPSVSLHSYLPSNFRPIQDVNKSLQLVPSSNNNSNQIPVQSSHSGSLGNPVSNHLVRPSTTTGGLEKLITAGSDGASRKRSLSDFLPSIPSLQGLQPSKPRKLRKISQSVQSPLPLQAYSSNLQSRASLTCGDVHEERNNCVPATIYASVLLHVIRHCSLCIKHAQLTAQMDSLAISYVEEVGLRTPSSTLWLRLPFAQDDSWKHICLRLGKAGSMSWDVRINDPHFRELWELNGGSTATQWGVGIRIANTSEMDSHISFDSDGVVLTYNTVEADSIQKLVSDLRRLSNARSFACGMRRLIGVKVDDKVDNNQLSTEMKPQYVNKSNSDASDKLSEQMRKTFRIEAVGLMSLWLSYGTMPMVHIVVEWEIAKGGCTMHVSPDQLWPHTKFLEDFVNGGEVASFLDCIRLTAGPLLALGGAIRPARMPVTVSSGYSTMPKQSNILTQGPLANGSSSSTIHHTPVPSNPAAAHLGSHNLHAAAMLSAAGRGGPGLVPSSLLPFDVSVVLRGPYWIRIIYRKKFSVDMRCFAGDQVWLQPATPPKGGPSVGGSLPCPQFRPFIMEHVAQGLNALEPNFMNATQASGHLNNNAGPLQTAPGASRLSATPGVSMSRPTSGVANHVAASLSRAGNAILASSALASGIGGASVRLTPGAGLPVHMKGELNTAFIGLGDDGGYGGGWVPLAALKKVLRGILKYLGVLWLFAQLPELLKEILGSILKDNEGALLNLDQEQPALRFYVGGYVFAVSVHRVQLLLQVLSVKRFHHQQQQQQAQSNAQEELAAAEINEICDYFSRRVASEPYDASRVASFITLLTLPISVLREFLKLIAWKKGFSQAHGDIATAQRARIELCLENHSGSVSADNTESSLAKSNIHHDRAHSSVEFALTFVLDHALIPQMNVAGGAAWLPYCISVRLRYSFGDNNHIAFLAMDGSHGGRACWLQLEEWERCKQKVARAVETVNGSAVAGEVGQGRLRMVAEMIQKQLQLCLQQLRDGPLSAGSTAS